ncbi:MAG: hypothetical protein R2827_12135 [Bdellovibrionales bacterium]
MLSVRGEPRKYSIDFAGQPNSKSQSHLQWGYFFDLENASGKIVTSCLQPWPDLGDPSLEQCYADIISLNRQNPLVNKSLYWAELLFDLDLIGDFLPTDALCLNSHRLAFSWEDPMQFASEKLLKVKMGHDLQSETQFLDRLVENNSKIKLRLDFNNSLEEVSFRRWVDKENHLLPNIDFSKIHLNTMPRFT